METVSRNEHPGLVDFRWWGKVPLEYRRHGPLYMHDVHGAQFHEASPRLRLLSKPVSVFTTPGRVVQCVSIPWQRREKKITSWEGVVEKETVT